MLDDGSSQSLVHPGIATAQTKFHPYTSKICPEIDRLPNIIASPGHSQTDGLVEQCNSILKSVRRTAADREEKDWDRLSSYFMFAYLEVPQASTGFSPVELLYGSPFRGLLDILKESSEAKAKG